MNGQILEQIANIVKTVGKKNMHEILKSEWIKFSLGVAIVSYPLTHLLVEVIKALKL